jgi:hypothetical protein
VAGAALLASQKRIVHLKTYLADLKNAKIAFGRFLKALCAV